MAQLMPLLLTISCFSKIQIGFTFLVLAYPGSPGQWASKRVCVCVLWVIPNCTDLLLIIIITYYFVNVTASPARVHLSAGQHVLTVKYGDVDVNGSPFYALVYDPQQVRVSGIPQTAVRDQPVNFDGSN